MRRTALSLLVGVMTLAGFAFARPAAADAWLGVYSQEITPDLREGMNYNGAGALVTRVVSGSPAAKAGVERGDVIVKVGGKDIASPGQLADVVGELATTTPVDVVVVRDGKKQTLRTTLATRSAVDSDDDVPPMPPMPPEHRSYGWTRHGDHDVMLHLPDFSGMGVMGRGRLGVRIADLSPDLASYFGSRDTKGALVVEVTEDSPAAKAGLKEGDVITKIGDKSIENGDDLLEAVRSSEGKVTVSLVRHNAKQTVEADLGKAPETMRYRRSPRAFEWHSDGSGHGKRIVIDGDDLDDSKSADQESMDALRDEVRQLKAQLEDLRKELKSNTK